jgi:hypothetical protein
MPYVFVVMMIVIIRMPAVVVPGWIIPAVVVPVPVVSPMIVIISYAPRWIIPIIPGWIIPAVIPVITKVVVWIMKSSNSFSVIDVIIISIFIEINKCIISRVA